MLLYLFDSEGWQTEFADAEERRQTKTPLRPLRPAAEPAKETFYDDDID